MLFDADNMRNDFPRFFHDDRISLADVFSFNFFRIVQACSTDRCTGELYWFQLGDGRDRSSLSDLDANRIQLRNRLVLLKLIGNGPSR